MKIEPTNKAVLDEAQRKRDKVVQRHQETIDGMREKQSCRGVGCIGCCYPIVHISFYEAMLIVRKLAKQKRPDVVIALIKQGRDQFQLEQEDENAPANWHNKRIPCPLLDLDTGGCSIYPIRPVACATYAVTSPPERCWPPSRSVLSFDNRQVLAMSYAIDDFFCQIVMAKRAPMPMPMGYMIQLAISVMAHGQEAIEEVDVTPEGKMVLT